MMRVKDQVLIVLADYQSCKRDEIDQKLDMNFESESNRVAIDVSNRVMNNYKILANRKNEAPFMSLARAAIEIYVKEAAVAKHDPWALSRDEGTRIRAAYDISRIIEERAGKAHKFSVWSTTIYSANKLLKKFKSDSHRGIDILVAAPSRKKAVEMINGAFGLHETVSHASSHWGGGGTVGNRVATKIGIWAAREGYKTKENYELVWEPKS